MRPFKKEETVTQPKKPLSETQRIKRRKMIVFPLMFLVFAACMWLIFSPSSSDKKKEQKGYNTDIPQPEKKGILSDKRDAYVQADMQEKQQERTGAMKDVDDMLGGGASNSNSDVPTMTDVKPENSQKGKEQSAARNRIRSSAGAYRDINRTMGGFYETPKRDTEKEELKAQVTSLQKQMLYGKSDNTMDDQIKLMEKSYQLAAKYIPGSINTGGSNNANTNFTNTTNTALGRAHAEAKRNDDKQILSATSVNGILRKTVSTLDNYNHNILCFNTVVGSTKQTSKNTISACIHGNQTVSDGQNIRLRLLEAIDVDGTVIPRGTVIIGTVKVGGERLNVKITNIEYDGTISPVSLTILDIDGQEGINIPGSLEANALKEIAANMGTSMGSSINLSTNAGTQFAADLGKGVVQGTSQYIAKKIRSVKIHLKAGYRVILYKNDNQ